MDVITTTTYESQYDQFLDEITKILEVMKIIYPDEPMRNNEVTAIMTECEVALFKLLKERIEADGY